MFFWGVLRDEWRFFEVFMGFGGFLGVFGGFEILGGFEGLNNEINHEY